MIIRLLSPIAVSFFVVVWDACPSRVERSHLDGTGRWPALRWEWLDLAPGGSFIIGV